MNIEQAILIPRVMGVYFIRNTINGKIYIGSSKDLRSRFYLHMRDLTTCRSTNRKLQNSVNKHGLDKFEFIIVASVLSKDKLIEVEQLLMDEHQSYKRGYNIRRFAHSNVGIIRTKEYRLKQSLARKGKKGTPCSDENKRAISAKNSGEGNGMYGQSHTKKARKKIGEASVAYWRNRIKPKRFKCVETGCEFDYIAEAVHAMKLKGYLIKCCLTGERNHTHGYHFKYL